jgi:hypothetical protein
MDARDNRFYREKPAPQGTASEVRADSSEGLKPNAPAAAGSTTPVHPLSKTVADLAAYFESLTGNYETAAMFTQDECALIASALRQAVTPSATK